MLIKLEEIRNRIRMYFGAILISPEHRWIITPKKREEDGCFDIFYDSLKLGQYKFVKANEIVKIGTGIHSVFSNRYRVVMKERSSLSLKGIAIRGGVIDSGYRGEWSVVLQNTSEKDVLFLFCENFEETEWTQMIRKNYASNATIIRIPRNRAIAQFSVQRVPSGKIHIIDNVSKFDSERGHGGFGSTDRR